MKNHGVCSKCKGRGFYQEHEVVNGGRHVVVCDHEPDEKYKRMVETLKRIQGYKHSENEEEK